MPLCHRESRPNEYADHFHQLQHEASVKNKEVAECRIQNCELTKENTSLENLLKTLLSSEAFSSFFDGISISDESAALPAALRGQAAIQSERKNNKSDNAPFDCTIQ